MLHEIMKRMKTEASACIYFACIPRASDLMKVVKPKRTASMYLCVRD